MDRSIVTAVDEAILVVGPNEFRGPGNVDEQHTSIAMRCIDDRLALVDDRVVSVQQLWHEVLGVAVGDAARVAVVVPSWWTRRRTSLVVGALPPTRRDVVVWKRADVLRSADTGAVVEIADELVAVHAGRGTPAVIPRARGAANVTAAVLDAIDGSATVVIDTPPGVADARVLGEEIARSLRDVGTPVSLADDGTVVRMVRMKRRRRRRRPGRRFVQPRAAAVAASVLLVAALTCAAVGSSADAPAVEPVWLIEGRVAVEVPADWKVERVTTGPGSARLQVVSPSDPKAAIHLTQSVVPMQQSLATAAEVLRNSLAAQPKGVFVDFTVADRQADRPAITYREVRPGHLVDWTVLLDGGVRIAVGCQSARDRGWPAWICERAIRSARVVP
jgi:type VII secretion-associated protein (TIGR03931 family)